MDSAYSLTIANEEDSTYLLLNSNSKDFIVFSDKSIELELFKTDGTVAKETDNTMPLETISGCRKLNSDNIMEALIKLRRAYTVSDNKIVMRIIKTEQAKAQDANTKSTKVLITFK